MGLQRAQGGRHKVDIAAAPPDKRAKAPAELHDPLPRHLARDLFEITLFGITFALRWYALAYIVGHPDRLAAGHRR